MSTPTVKTTPQAAFAKQKKNLVSVPAGSIKPLALAEPVTLTIVPPPSAETQLAIVKPGELSDAEMGRQLTAQFEEVKQAEFKIFIFGGMMLQIRAKVDSARGVNSPTRGPGTKGTGLKAWMKKHAPKVSNGRAYCYMHLAEGLINEFKISDKTDLVHLLSAPKTELAKPQQSLREKIEKFVDGKSTRHLEFHFATSKKPKSEDEEPTPERTMEEKVADYIASCCNDSKDIFTGLHGLEHKWQFLPDPEIKGAVSAAKQFAKEAEAWLKLPPKDRTKPDAAKLIEEADLAEQTAIEEHAE